jgi:tripartite-type tricarboxylate transporter receptor subunit TctC
MKPPRRQFLQLATGAAALPAMSRYAWAQAYPTRPVRLVVGFLPGGIIDAYARLIGQWLSERLGQPFIIENRAGASGNLGAEAVVRAAPDGYTLLQSSAVNSWNMGFFTNTSFDFVRDMAHVGSIYKGAATLIVHPAFPPKTVPELIAYAKANPGRINMASNGVGTAQHVFGELFKIQTQVDMAHVPYRGSSALLPDLISGQVQLSFEPTGSAIEHIRAGKVRALAVTSAERLAVLPDIATIGEFVQGYEATGWQGISAPRNTPPEIISKLNREIKSGLADARLKARIADLGATVFMTSPDEFGVFIADYTRKWVNVIKTAGIKPE